MRWRPAGISSVTRSRAVAPKASTASRTMVSRLAGSGSASRAPIATWEASLRVSIIATSSPRCREGVGDRLGQAVGVDRRGLKPSLGQPQGPLHERDRLADVVDGRRKERFAQGLDPVGQRRQPDRGAPSRASPTMARPATTSEAGAASSSMAAIARLISCRRSRNSVTTAIGPRPCSNRACAWAVAAASMSGSSSGAVASRRALSRRTVVMASNRVGMWSAIAPSGRSRWKGCVSRGRKPPARGCPNAWRRARRR